jgi:protein-disulfide isomerase
MENATLNREPRMPDLTRQMGGARAAIFRIVNGAFGVYRDLSALRQNWKARRMISRRTFVATSLAFGAMPAFAQKGDIFSEAMIWRDPAIPAAGNPNGNLTLVEFSDFNCPYCRKVFPVMQKVVREDGDIRLIYKVWPIFGPPSVYGAQMTLASRGQGKYVQAYDALMSSNTRITEETADRILASAGIDVSRAKQDLKKNIGEIGGILKRHHAQAEGLSFQGTPSFIIGKFRLFGAQSEEVFKQAIADARKALKS